MKRIISLLLLLGLAATYLTAQTTTAPTTPNAETAVAEDDYSTQTGTLLITRSDGSHLELVYTLHPQPAYRYLTLALQTNQPIRPEVYLRDLDGTRTPVATQARAANSRLQLRLDVRALAEGMYHLVVAVPGDGESMGLPIIKLDDAPVLLQ